MAAGDAHSLIIKTDNSLWATGNNFYGQLGDGTKSDKYNFIKISDNNSSTSIIKADNTLWATGSYYRGETSTFALTANDVIAVAGGGDGLFIVKTDNTLWAKGYNWLDDWVMEQQQIDLFSLKLQTM